MAWRQLTDSNKRIEKLSKSTPKVNKTPEKTTKTTDLWVSTGKTDDKYLLALADAFKGKRKARMGSGAGGRRISFDNLELEYNLDEVAFRCVNFYVGQVTGPDFEMIGDEKAVSVIEEFKNRTRLMLILEEVIRDLCICGNSFWEKIKATNGKIVDLQRIDYKKIDYKRQYGNGLVEEDDSGKPIGYKFKPSGIDAGDIIEFIPDDILHFKLFARGNDLAHGFIEPLYKLIYLKLNIRDGFAQAGYRAGHPLYHIQVGDQPNPSMNYPGHIRITDDERGKIEDAFTDIDVKDKIITPYYVNVKQLESTTGQPQEVLMQYCDSRIAGAFGVPLGLVLGTEDRSNRTTLEVAVTRGLDKQIKSIQNKISLILETQLFPELLEQNNIDTARTPKIRWKDVIPADLNRKAKRIQTYIELGILYPDDVRNMILKEEGLKISEEEQAIKKFAETLQDFESKRITPEEAIIALKRIQNSFSGANIKKLIDKIIQEIMLKTTGVDMPVEGPAESRDKEKEVKKITDIKSK